MNIVEFLKSCKARSKAFDQTVTVHVVGNRQQFIEVGSVYLHHVVGPDKSAVRFGKDKGFIKHKNLLLLPVSRRAPVVGNTCVGTIICAYGNDNGRINMTDELIHVCHLSLTSARMKFDIPLADLIFHEYVGPGPASI